MFHLRNEKAFTLIEVVASLLLITIILISFIPFFLYSNKTTKTSSTIVDATYYAQAEMEEIYFQNKNKNYSSVDDFITNTTNSHLGYPPLTSPSSSVNKITGCDGSANKFYSAFYTFNKNKNGHLYKLTIKQHCLNKDITNVKIEIYDKTVLKSMMENIFIWK